MSLAPREVIDTDAIDIAQEKVRTVDDLNVWPVWENGKMFYRLEHRGRQRFYRVGFREYTFLSLLDGKTSVASACGIAASKLGTQALTSEETESLVIWLLGEGLVTVTGMNVDIRSDNVKQNTIGWRALNPFWIQIPIAKASASLDACLRFIAPVFHRRPTLLGLAVIVVGLVAYGLHFEAVHRSAGNLFSATGWIYFLITWVLLKVVHELGHAAACKRSGAEVAEVGIVFMLFAPLAYVDVTSCWRLPRAFSRIFVSLAGMYVELVIAASAMFAWLVCDSVEARFWLANIIITAGVSTIVFNANPLMRFDGYYVLSDAVGIPNLYGEASAELRRVAKYLFYGDSLIGSPYRGSRRAFLFVYGVAALFWRLTICFALCAAASFLFSGAGIVLAAFGLIAWFGPPLRTFVATSIEAFQIDRPRLIRALAVGTTSFVVIASLVFLPFGTGVSLPGVVQDPPRAILRSSADGFVKEIHVDDGSRVVAGQPLITMQNKELDAELSHLELQRAAVTIQRRIATDAHDASSAWVAEQELAAINRQVSELRPKVEGLTLIAPHDGFISRRELSMTVGSFIREGDELLRISGAGRKEIVAAAHQDQIETVRGSHRRRVQIRDVRRRRFETELGALEPRASRRLPDPALSSLSGGPLQVQSTNESHRDGQNETLRLLEPHFVVRAAVRQEDEDQLLTGSRVRLMIGYRRQSLWDRAQVALSRY
ncbi:MAG: efflux RND transporter periplasmic adaptor subunit [Planctomycetota bacterium]